MFKISGKERRQLKKELNEWKQFLKMYWFYDDIDSTYGLNKSNEEHEKNLNNANNKIKILTTKLQAKWEDM